jgi:hypothetical protein
VSASLKQIHARLEATVKRLTSSEEWAAMLRVAARFHAYSLNNQLLIYAQRPAATRVAGLPRLAAPQTPGQKGRA